MSVSVEQKRFHPTPNLQRRHPSPDVTAATNISAAATSTTTPTTAIADKTSRTAAATTKDTTTDAITTRTTAATTSTAAVFTPALDPAAATPRLPKGWNKVIEERDRQWISQSLYESKNVARLSSKMIRHIQSNPTSSLGGKTPQK